MQWLGAGWSFVSSFDVPLRSQPAIQTVKVYFLEVPPLSSNKHNIAFVCSFRADTILDANPLTIWIQLSKNRSSRIFKCGKEWRGGKRKNPAFCRKLLLQNKSFSYPSFPLFSSLFPYPSQKLSISNHILFSWNSRHTRLLSLCVRDFQSFLKIKFCGCPRKRETILRKLCIDEFDLNWNGEK